jgi:hypothetical protein
MFSCTARAFTRPIAHCLITRSFSSNAPIVSRRWIHFAAAAAATAAAVTVTGIFVVNSSPSSTSSQSLSMVLGFGLGLSGLNLKARGAIAFSSLNSD